MSIIDMIATDLSHCILKDERVVPIYAAYNKEDKVTYSLLEATLVVCGPYYHDHDLDHNKPLFINADTTGEMNLHSH